MRLSVGTLRQVVKRDLAIAFVPSSSRRTAARTAASLRASDCAATSAAGRVRRARRRLRRGPAGSAGLGASICRCSTAGASAVPGGRPARAPLRGSGAGPDGADRGQLAPALHPGNAAAAGAAQPGGRARHVGPAQRPAAHARCRRHCRAHRRHRGLGLPWLQSSPPEGSQLLSAARPRRADRPHPAGQESAGQRARLQAIGPVPARADRRGPLPPGRRLPLEFRMDAAFFQPACPAPARRPGLRLRHQSWLLELAADQAAGRRTATLACSGPRRDGLRAPTRHPSVEAAPAGDDLPQARPAREPEELPARPLHS